MSLVASSVVGFDLFRARTHSPGPAFPAVAAAASITADGSKIAVGASVKEPQPDIFKSFLFFGKNSRKNSKKKGAPVPVSEKKRGGVHAFCHARLQESVNGEGRCLIDC